MCIIGQAVSEANVAEAASIWARAAARRDGRSGHTDVASALAGIRRRLALDGATLTLARRDVRAIGFDLVAPREHVMEIFYVAVDPDVWGDGVAGLLLQDARSRARVAGCRTLELWVIDDNHRAKAVYERAGWLSTGETQPDAASGRAERRFIRHVDALAHGRHRDSSTNAGAGRPVADA
ncbi:hypothetical protein AFL01nite_14380 [Aeromicrobium flavum]|uniref:N-acetyltransferase domain-containing protein n=1 Tax=Aeromicrobium flavum TaxID=416568 RepID=A0A512HUJ2_9ACTN|nr:GNAT family N-acetyltransferase [Aeromicrobium flavum]GEO89111.1 hypothetical protein AFL01nite_14380 [Aeromicrobium flavum]